MDGQAAKSLHSCHGTTPAERPQLAAYNRPGEPTVEELMARIAALQAENRQLTERVVKLEEERIHPARAAALIISADLP